MTQAIAHRSWQKLWWHVLTPIAGGTAIYVLWRSPTLLVFRWLETMHLNGVVDMARHIALPIRGFIPKWVLYSLPDALWVYSLMYYMRIVWSGVASRIAWVWISSGLSLIVAAEIGQALEVIRGRFDVYDLLACSAAGMLVLSQTRRLPNESMRS